LKLVFPKSLGALGIDGLANKLKNWLYVTSLRSEISVEIVLLTELRQLLSL
jgi:hypothetical protein